MKNVCSKLRSESGASMIIALMFMLMCVFIGGSILVAATVNSGRISRNRENQQLLLTQQSACRTFTKLLFEGEAVSTSKYENYKENGDLLKCLVCRAALDNEEQTFSIADSDGKKQECYVVCKKDNYSKYSVYIGFKGDDSQVQLRLLGQGNSNRITWSSGKMIKAGIDE